MRAVKTVQMAIFSNVHLHSTNASQYSLASSCLKSADKRRSYLFD